METIFIGIVAFLSVFIGSLIVKSFMLINLLSLKYELYLSFCMQYYS